jgi:hypothetical protein
MALGLGRRCEIAVLERPIAIQVNADRGQVTAIGRQQTIACDL